LESFPFIRSQTKSLAEAYPHDGDPLWPALARHIIGESTDADRDPLETVARHPEAREIPLFWGLRYLNEICEDLVMRIFHTSRTSLGWNGDERKACIVWRCGGQTAITCSVRRATGRPFPGAL
jgi:hypothetical protein